MKAQNCSTQLNRPRQTAVHPDAGCLRFLPGHKGFFLTSFAKCLLNFCNDLINNEKMNKNKRSVWSFVKKKVWLFWRWRKFIFIKLLYICTFLATRRHSPQSISSKCVFPIVKKQLLPLSAISLIMQMMMSIKAYKVSSLRFPLGLGQRLIRRRRLERDEIMTTHSVNHDD